MAGYADYCPIAGGVEVLGDRWTPLVIRELMVGATRFNEIHRGIPRASRSLLAQRLHQSAIPERLPSRRTVVHVVLTGPGGAEAWLDVAGGAVTVCKDDQGYDVDLAVEAETRHLHRWVVGRVSFNELVADGHARLLGPSRLARAFPGWFRTDTFAPAAERGRRREQRVTA